MSTSRTLTPHTRQERRSAVTFPARAGRTAATGEHGDTVGVRPIVPPPPAFPNASLEAPLLIFENLRQPARFCASSGKLPPLGCLPRCWKLRRLRLCERLVALGADVMISLIEIGTGVWRSLEKRRSAYVVNGGGVDDLGGR